MGENASAAGGREERWIAPAPALEAVNVLERIDAPIRRADDPASLFNVLQRRGNKTQILDTASINKLMNIFAMGAGVPDFEGQRWQFSTHQLRKTFARFVAMRDRSNLLALAEHFKHISFTMTSQAYVGTDFELRELISEEARAETAVALDRLLSSERLAGRMGERIRATGAVFRGRAGAQVRSDYISFIMRETDLRIYACDYGWCVFQPETARCGGEHAPNDAARSPAVCLSCANMVMEPKHAPYWRERRERNAQLLPTASLLAKAALTEAIGQCDKVLDQLEKHHGEAEETRAVGRSRDRGAGVPGALGRHSGGSCAAKGGTRTMRVAWCESRRRRWLARRERAGIRFTPRIETSSTKSRQRLSCRVALATSQHASTSSRLRTEGCERSYCS